MYIDANVVLSHQFFRKSTSRWNHLFFSSRLINKNEKTKKKKKKNPSDFINYGIWSWRSRQYSNLLKKHDGRSIDIVNVWHFSYWRAFRVLLVKIRHLKLIQMISLIVLIIVIQLFFSMYSPPLLLTDNLVPNKFNVKSIPWSFPYDNFSVYFPFLGWVPALFTSGYEDYTNHICYITNTYYVNQTQKIPRTGPERQSLQLLYYQWIPFILCFLR